MFPLGFSLCVPSPVTPEHTLLALAGLSPSSRCAAPSFRQRLFGRGCLENAHCSTGMAGSPGRAVGWENRTPHARVCHGKIPALLGDNQPAGGVGGCVGIVSAALLGAGGAQPIGYDRPNGDLSAAPINCCGWREELGGLRVRPHFAISFCLFAGCCGVARGQALGLPRLISSWPDPPPTHTHTS